MFRYEFGAVTIETQLDGRLFWALGAAAGLTVALLAARLQPRLRRFEVAAVALMCGAVGIAGGVGSAHVEAAHARTWGPVGWSSFYTALWSLMALFIWSPGRGPRAARLVDLLVCSGLVALAIARLGCLVDGCDFGPPSDLPWAFRYGSSTDAFAWQRMQGLIPPTAPATLPVQPFAAYDAAATGVAAALGAFVLCTSSTPGSAALLASLVWLAARALTEQLHCASACLELRAACMPLVSLIAATAFVLLTVYWLFRARRLRADVSATRA